VKAESEVKRESEGRKGVGGGRGARWAVLAHCGEWAVLGGDGESEEVRG
jgi:hypothetical protein